ncbi:carboxypeptidase-like regulatory domain-containing protein [Algoriphagus sp. AGSA1]|uniref:carboxypeptidase-like regulatory domain-containing protein n=1 Tax=Algoriphagus sp. AGSA1 TaxID=2907213 RepID=UPI001F15B67A|nr:carboxypeptidase-like regulatory domain-containing protein [Algoriphagus sp. AGSA1]MCE7054588.1 carboxypeptidase-like regulatory domain-containing protein [Algoriphagus sp. AGSA1]
MNKPNPIPPKIALGFFLLLCTFTSYAQHVFRGTVADYETGEVIPYATVFLANTTFGVSADEEGRFSLAIPEGNYEVIVRMLGYEGLTYNLRTSEIQPQGYKLMLIAADEELDILDVKESRDPAWYRNLDEFKRNFLGTSETAQSCKLLDETVLRLDDQSEAGVLKVSAIDLLKINNPKLGYRIDYLLKEFKFQAREGYVFYAGYPFFIDDSTLSKSKRKKVEKRRDIAYRGSLQHLIRSLYEGVTEREGFVLRKIYRIPDPSKPGKYMDQLDTTPISPDVLVKKNLEGEVFLSFQDHLHITYTHERESLAYLGSNYRGKPGNQVSIMHLEIDSLKIYPNGSYDDPFGLLMEGYMAWERVGDLLPIDYGPEQ